MSKPHPVEASALHARRERVWPQLWWFIGSGYVFKACVALLDILPLYLGVRWLGGYPRLDPSFEHAADLEQTG